MTFFAMVGCQVELGIAYQARRLICGLHDNSSVSQFESFCMFYGIVDDFVYVEFVISVIALVGDAH